MSVQVHESIDKKPNPGVGILNAIRAKKYVPKRMLPLPDTFAKVPTASEKHDYRVTAHALYSVHQFVADTVFIVGITCADGVLYAELKRGIVGPLQVYAIIGLVLALLFGFLSRVLARNRFVIRTSAFYRVREALEIWTLTVAAFVFLLFMLKAGVLRGFMLSLFFLGLPSLACWRAFFPLTIERFARRSEASGRECIVIGDVNDPVLNEFTAELKSDGHSVLESIRFRAGCHPSQWGDEIKRLFLEVANSARNLGPGEIYICSGTIPSDRLATIFRTLAILPRAIFVVPDAQTSSLVRCKPAAVGRHYALEVRREPLGPFQRFVKRLIDVCVSGVALVVLAPFFAFIALAIKLDSKGDVFFHQTRNGYQGKPFKIWKFRSMLVSEDGPKIRQASKDDPRVTRVGRFLRKSSIDELPQLINIFFGSMSLVGPRPHAQAHDKFYAGVVENYEIRQHVKPGLTGWAQVNGLRGETATVEAMLQRIQYDVWYASNASTILDLEILFRTVFAVLRQRNAY